MMTRTTQPRTIALRQYWLLSIAWWAFTLTSGVANAQPQPYDGRADLTSIPPSPSASFPSGLNGVATPIVVRGPCDPDYWIVSTRNAQAQIDCGQAANFEVLRYDGPGHCRRASLDELLASLQPGVPVCFMAHGSFVTWESMLVDSARTYPWLRQAAPNQPIHIIFYTWASDDGALFTHLKVNKFGQRASLNGLYLADLVTKISADHPVCLIGHSHGTRLVSASLHALAGGAVDGRVLACGPQPPRHIRVVLAAAAIDHDWLNPTERFGLALCQSEAVVNLKNSHDFPLLFYPLRRPISTPAMAISGVTRRDRVEMGSEGQKIVDLNVTHQIGLGHVWGYYYNRPEIAAAIRPYVYFDQ